MAKLIKFDHKELTQFRKNLGELRAQIPSVTRDTVENIGRHLAEDASEFTPIMWGNLQDHWKVTKPTWRSRVASIYVINDLNYASFVEEGFKQRKGWLPGQYMNTPGGYKFQYIPKAKTGIMLHGGWVEGSHMWELAEINYESSNVAQSSWDRYFSLRWEQVIKQ